MKRRSGRMKSRRCRMKRGAGPMKSRRRRMKRAEVEQRTEASLPAVPEHASVQLGCAAPAELVHQ
jgi:hypothetical protein